MKRLDRYIFLQVMAVTVFITVILTGIMLMTQSLRFLDLIISSGASGVMFLTLTLLAIPRFFEVILPVALAVAATYVFVRLRQDGEMTILHSSGLSPARIARPGIICAASFGVVLFVVLSSIAPITLSQMYQMRQDLRMQFSASMLRPGVFHNLAGGKVTVYIEKRVMPHGLQGVMIYDSWPENREPVTVLAQAGELMMTDAGPRILVQKGVRLTKNKFSGGLDRLEFDRYIIDLPDQGPLQARWAEPEERTLLNLLTKAGDDPSVRAQWSEFRAEIHRRFLSPLLPLTLYLVVAAIMIRGGFTRAFQNMGPVVLAGIAILLVQGAYLGAFPMAKKGPVGIALMYVVVMAPMIFACLRLGAIGFLFGASGRGSGDVRDSLAREGNIA